MEKITLKLGKNQQLFNCFLSIKDPRVGGRCIYPLINIITIVLCALICGCDNWKAIEMFGRERKHWLSHYIDLSTGIPSDQTIARVFSLIDPEEFEKCLISWAAQVGDLIAGDIINIDGKTMRGSSHKAGGKKASHIINAYSAKEQLTIGSVKTPDKTNEIKGIPKLLKLLNIKDKIITIDAMGTQKGIANLIRIKQGHYLLALKKNHKRFYRKVARLFENGDTLKHNAMVFKQDQSLEYDHSRIETREYTVLPIMYLPRYKKIWRDIQAFVRIKSERQLRDGSIETATRYYITSVPFRKYKSMCLAIREHWQIESGLHYKLDVGMREDQCQIYRGHADRNLGVMRKIVLKLLNDENTTQAGIAMKRTKAALNSEYLAKVVGF